MLYRVNVTRARHPKKEVEKALAQMEKAGWEVAMASSGHRWGVAKCGEASRAGCQVSIWSTPRSPGHHARQLLHRLEQCSHEWNKKED